MPGGVLNVAAAEEARMLADHFIPAHQHYPLGVRTHRGDACGVAAVDAVAIAIKVHEARGRDSPRVFGKAVKGRRHLTQHRAFLLPHLDDFAGGLLRMISFARQL